MHHQGGFVGTLLIYINLMTVWDREMCFRAPQQERQTRLRTQKYIGLYGEVISESVVDANNESSC